MTAFARFLLVVVGILATTAFLLAVSGHGAASLALAVIIGLLAVIVRRSDRADR